MWRSTLEDVEAEAAAASILSCHMQYLIQVNESID